MKTKHFAKLLLQLIACAALASCSALRIDVDVYKGPLLNEQSTQETQLVAMTVAAKALLESGRDLHCDRRKNFGCETLSNVLALYKARPQPEAALTLGRMLDTSNAYLDAQERWKDRRAEAASSVEGLLATWNRGNCSGPVGKPCLADALAKLLFEQSNTSSRKSSSAKPVVIAMAELKLIGGEDAKHWSSADFNNLLRKEQLRANLAKALSKDAAEQGKIENLLRQFSEYQSEKHRQLGKAMNALLGLESADLITAPMENRDNRRLRALVVDAVLSSTQLRNLACGLELARTDLGSPLLPSTVKRNAMWSRTDYEAAGESLREQLVNNFDETQQKLLAAHEAFRKASPAAVKNCLSLFSADSGPTTLDDYGSVGTYASRAQGIAAVSAPAKELVQRIELAKPLVAQLLNQMTAGLQSGRLDEGISYLADQVTKSGSNPSSNTHKRNMKLFRSAVIGLGEKMRYLAVNGWAIAGGNADEYRGSQTISADFTILLATVGNSLIAQADESSARSIYEEPLSMKAQQESWAWRAAQKRTAGDVLSALKSHLVTSAKSLQLSVEDAKLQEAVDTLLAKIKKSEAAAKTLNQEVKDKEAKLSALTLVQQLFSTTAPKKEKGNARLLEDRKSMRALVLAEKGKEKSFDQFKQTLLAYLTQRIQEESGNEASKDSKRLKAAHAVLNEYTYKMVVASYKDYFEHLQKTFSANAEGASLALVEATTKATENTNEAKQHATDLEKAQASLKSRALPAAAPAIAKAQSLLAEHAIDFAASQGGLHAVVDGNAFIAGLAAHIKKTAIASDAVTTALQQISSFGVAQSYEAPLNTQAKDAKQVLDGVIAMMRQRYLLAVSEGGKTSAAATNLQDAIAAALKQRADLAYLRPTSSYLRSIHTSIVTQGGSGLGWSNMLSDGGIKSLPVIGSSIVQARDGGNPELIEQIDKSFWQTINTVQLNGTGRSNFVVAKDDVGNWYVKAMGSDPAEMVKATKNLLLFNLGKNLDRNLLRLDALRDKLNSETGAVRESIDTEIQALQANSPNGNAAFSAVVSKYDDKYSKGLLADYDSLFSTVDSNSLEEKLTAAVKAQKWSDEQKAALEKIVAAESQYRKDAKLPASASVKGDIGLSKGIASSLTNLRSWSVELKSKVGGAQLDSTEELARVKAQDDVKDKQKKVDASAKVLESVAADADAKTWNKAAQDKRDADKALEAANATLVDKVTAKTAAVARIDALKSQIDSILIAGEVKRIAQKRLDAIRATENSTLAVAEVASTN